MGGSLRAPREKVNVLTVYDLDGFLDQLADLTREADPMEIVVEATALVSENPAQRFLMQRRAAAACDAHYLQGVSLRNIAKAVGMTTQTVRNWLDNHGPQHYLTLGFEPDAQSAAGDSRLTLRLLPVESDDRLMKVRIREQWNAGRVIAPATLGLVDPGQPDGITERRKWPVTAEQLWKQLFDGG